MILNISRASTFQECRTKSMYYSKQRLAPFRVADPLLLGGSYHKGLAHMFAKKDPVGAILIAEKDYRDAYARQTSMILPEEKALIERNCTWMNNSLAEFSKHYNLQDVEVLQPEVEFCVPLPDTEHHCGFFHRILHPGESTEGCQDSRCIQPHWFKGKTDAVVQWKNNIWLFEHKTEARTGDVYFTRFLLDFQPTGYIYGIKQATGIRPAGFILNIIKKPNSQFKGDPLTVVGFEREAYIRSDADLDRFAGEFSSLADDFETAFFNPRKAYMNTKACTGWGRKCEFHDICMNHGEFDLGGQFQIRPEWDYVELEYYKILGLPTPAKPTQDLVNITL